MKLHGTTERLDVEDADLSASRFKNAKLSGAEITDCDMTGWRLEDVNLSGSRIENADLSGLEITNCRLTGATIDGIAIEDLLAAYRRASEGS